MLNFLHHGKEEAPYKIEPKPKEVSEVIDEGQEVAEQVDPLILGEIKCPIPKEGE